MLTHRMPFPPSKGDKIRSFNLLAYLVRRHEVYVASLVDDEQDLVHTPEITGRARGFVYQVIGRKLRTMLSLRAVLQRRSVSVTYFYSPRLQSRIDALIDTVPFDCYLCFSSPMAEYLFRSRHRRGRLAGAMRIMDLIDVDSYKWRQYADRSPFWTAWIYRREAMHLSAYEQRIARTFDRLLVVSEQERRHFPDSAFASRLLSLSNGVDLEFFNPRHVQSKQVGGTFLVFTGMMDYWPNIEGIAWFVAHILPTIQRSVPGTELYIVGSRPTPAVRKLARSKGVTVTGYVSDVRHYLAAASVCVAPLRIARGIQNKVLEAMAMGKAVVTTAQAFEGLRAVAGEDIIVASSEAEFTDAVIGLLRDGDRAKHVGARARLCVEQNYAWESNLATLSKVGL